MIDVVVLACRRWTAGRGDLLCYHVKIDERFEVLSSEMPLKGVLDVSRVFLLIVDPVSIIIVDGRCRRHYRPLSSTPSDATLLFGKGCTA